MTRKEEIIEEFKLAMENIEKWGLEKINSYSEDDLEKERHLLGIDMVHDACHTLRGRLPKTGKVDLKSMGKSWKGVF